MSGPTEKILVRGVNWLGDAVMTTPALQRLREARPGAQVTLFTHEKLAGLWGGHPSLDAILTFGGESVLGVARKLRMENFDAAVIFPNSPRSALEVLLARIPRRIGYARNGRRLFLTDALPERAGAAKMHKRSRTEIAGRIASHVPRETFPATAHHVHDYLELVAALGANPEPLPPRLFVSDAEVRAICSKFGLNGREPLFALNPGAEYGDAKRWPAARFVQAAAELHQATGCCWIVLGGSGERELVSRAAQQLAMCIPADHFRNLVGETSLRDLCALLKASALVLTNDTGPMHVAAALGTPVVVPFGSTSPDLTGPSLVAASSHQLLVGQAACAPCFLRECPIDFRCMKSISVEQVVKAALSAWPARR